MADEEGSVPAPALEEEENPPDRGSRVPPSTTQKEGRRRRLEGVIPEIVRRAVELGVEKAQEAPDNLKSFVGDMKVPKDIAHYVFAQIDETKNGLFRVVAKEMRDFLEHTNFAGEMQKLLTTVQFEVNTTIRFTPNDGSSSKKKDDENGDESTDDEAGADLTGPPPPDEALDGRRPLPKPEVKTAVHVRRDDRERGRRRR